MNSSMSLPRSGGTLRGADEDPGVGGEQTDCDDGVEGVHGLTASRRSRGEHRSRR